MHGAQLVIASNTAGVVTGNCGGGVCVETDNLSLALSPTGNHMTATITKITFTDSDTGSPVPNLAETGAIGDSFSLRFVAPHLLKQTIIHSSLSAIDQQNGNPYWCGAGLAPSLVHLCGA